MKFALAILTYVVIAAVLGAGILLLLQGKPWLLVAGVVVYLLAFAQIGCRAH